MGETWQLGRRQKGEGKKADAVGEDRRKEVRNPAPKKKAEGIGKNAGTMGKGRTKKVKM